MFSNWMSKISEKIAESSAFQELKSKWDALDAQSQNYIRIAAILFSVVGTLGLTVYEGIQTYALKNELKDKKELLATLIRANDELKNLKSDTVEDSNKTSGIKWSNVLEDMLSTNSIDRASFEMLSEKPSTGKANAVAKETWIDFKLKSIDLKQLVRFSVGLESHRPPMKVKQITLDKASQSNKVDAKFVISGFEPTT